MSNTKLNKIKQLLGLESTEVETPEVEVKLEQIKLENGTVLEAEAFEPGYPKMSRFLFLLENMN